MYSKGISAKNKNIWNGKIFRAIKQFKKINLTFTS